MDSIITTKCEFSKFGFGYLRQGTKPSTRLGARLVKIKLYIYFCTNILISV
jgi:hypothetical protein